MKKSGNYIINVLAAGFLTLALLSVLLFWSRKVIQSWMYELQGNDTIKIQPSGLLPRLDSEPNVVEQSYVAVSIRGEVLSLSFGLVQDFFQEVYGSRRRPGTGNGLYNRLGIGRLYYFDNFQKKLDK